MSLDHDRALLGLDDRFDAGDVVAAYRRQARVLHPDAGGTDDQMTKLTDARDRLIASFDSPPAEPTHDVGVRVGDGMEGRLLAEDRDEVKLRFYLVPLVAFPLFVIFLVSLANTIG